MKKKTCLPRPLRIKTRNLDRGFSDAGTMLILYVRSRFSSHKIQVWGDQHFITKITSSYGDTKANFNNTHLPSLHRLNKKIQRLITCLPNTGCITMPTGQDSHKDQSLACLHVRTKMHVSVKFHQCKPTQQNT